MVSMRPATRLAGISVALCALLAACEPESGTSEQRAADAAALFQENCTPCHGQQGRGPALTELRALEPDELRAAIRNHPTAGHIPQLLPAADVQKLIEYIEE